MAAGASTPVLAVLADLQSIFGTRLQAFVVYAPARTPRPSVAIVQSLELADLDACAARAAPLAARRRGDASGPHPPRVRAFARRVPGRVRRDHRDPRDALRRRPVRRDCRWAPPICAAPAKRRPGRCCSTCARTTWRPPATRGRSPAWSSTRPPTSARWSRCWPASTAAGSTAPNWPAWAGERLGLDPRVVSDVLHIANQPETRHRGSGAPLPRLPGRGRTAGAPRRRVVSGASSGLPADRRPACDGSSRSCAGRVCRRRAQPPVRGGGAAAAA